MSSGKLGGIGTFGIFMLSRKKRDIGTWKFNIVLVIQQKRDFGEIRGYPDMRDFQVILEKQDMGKIGGSQKFSIVMVI